MLKRVEKYDIVDEIGHGGMAVVYRARDTRLDRLVALKVMHPHLQGAKEARQRFAREALTVARLHHPSILEIYDYSGEDSEISFIATELLTGPTLKVFAEQHPDIPAEIAACMAIAVARALGAAHAEGVIHRDVKPENVMLHENSSVKLTDFGIAQLVDVQGMTTTGQVLGSPAHMAPEQIEGRECDARSDLFALGTVLYLLAVGELPFTGTNPHQLLKRIMEGNFKDPLQARPTIGGRLASIIRRLLEIDPARRYQTAAELELELLSFVAEVGIDSPGQALALYLADPTNFATALRSTAIDRLSDLGERAQRIGNLPLALDYYNRVLAMDDGNQRVMSALQGLGRRTARRRLLVMCATATGVIVLVALGVSAALRPPALVPAAPAGRGAQSTPRSIIAAAARPGPPPPVPSGSAMPAASAAGNTPPPRPGRSHPAAAPSGPRVVTFNPFPANVSIGVDGESPRPFGPSFREITLSPGVHRFKFAGARDCCIDEEVNVKVPAGEGSFTVTQRLRFRPAGLYVVTDTPANVLVDDGRISGRSRSVIQVSDLGNMVENHRIRVSAEGRSDHEQDVRLEAGQVVTVEVAMARPAGGS
jgi:serine/threonine-protein kinase